MPFVDVYLKPDELTYMVGSEALAEEFMRRHVTKIHPQTNQVLTMWDEYLPVDMVWEHANGKGATMTLPSFKGPLKCEAAVMMTLKGKKEHLPEAMDGATLMRIGGMGAMGKGMGMGDATVQDGKGADGDGGRYPDGNDD